MSKSWGAVKFPDDTICYCIYNGTIDLMYPGLLETSDLLPFALQDYWADFSMATCTCLVPNHESIEILSDYGGGFYWPGTACRKCLVIAEGTSAYVIKSVGDKIIDPGPEWLKGGHPDWSPWKEK